MKLRRDEKRLGWKKKTLKSSQACNFLKSLLQENSFFDKGKTALLATIFYQR